MSNEFIQQIVMLKIEEEYFGLSVMNVNEIIFAQNIQPITTKNNAVVGVINLRGNVISIVDIRVLLNKTAIEPNKKQRIIIVTEQGKSLGILVDEVSVVAPTTHMEFDSAPKSVTPYVFGICKHPGKKEIVYMLETTKLVNEIEGDVYAK